MMGYDSGFNEKMDTIDLIIHALKDHEKRLDEIAGTLDGLLKGAAIEKSGEARVEGVMGKEASQRRPRVLCEGWKEFRERSEGAEAVAFRLEEASFRVDSVVNGVIFGYVEELPGRRLRVSMDGEQLSIDRESLRSIECLQSLIQGRLKCGLRLYSETSKTTLTGGEYLLEVCYGYDAVEAEELLSRELKVSKERILEGRAVY